MSPDSPSSAYRRRRTVVHRDRRNPRTRFWVPALAVAVIAVLGVLTLEPDPGRWFRFGDDSSELVTASTGAAAPSVSPAPSTSAPSASTPAAAATPRPASAGPSTEEAKTGGVAAGCGRPVSSTAKVEVTHVALPKGVVSYGGEGDTETLPMAIAATPSGRSWLAWLGTDKRVHLGQLDCNDRLTGKPTSFAGVDLQDVQADSAGGVLLLTRTGDCHTGPLCGGASSPCRTMHIIRFDNAGHQVWDRQLTNLGGSRGGYDDGARFVWWYQHHGRLAYDGKNYAAYFGVAITVQNGNCVDIHEGDRMQVVDASGRLLSGHQSFDVGCSHAWTSRVVWDPRVRHFAAVCATDNGCRIAQPNPYRTVASGACDGTLFGGDLVLAKGRGYWTAWSQGGAVRLSRFTTGAANLTVRPGVATSHPHLVAYGANRMLLAWQAGSTMKARVFNSGSGKAVGGTLNIAVRDHDYQAFKSYADGSAAYPAAGSGGTSVKIARVLPQR